uniref:type II secretion system protein GspL n=1 Tax=Pelomonas sp. KK5 TaxID=1855730 RepID=UPI001E5CBCD2
MSTLLLHLPPRRRASTPGEPAAEFDFLLSEDGGRHIARQGRAPAAQLPAAELVVAIPAESDIAWHRVTLPRAGRQMRAALAGLLEEALLDDPEQLHFALAPGAAPGDEAWVAVTSRPWLAAQLAALEAAQVFVDRVTPLAWPEAQPRGHFEDTGRSETPVVLRYSHADGVATLPL